MFRWASSGLVVALAVGVGGAQTADVISEISGGELRLAMRPNPFGGAPVPVVQNFGRVGVPVMAGLQPVPPAPGLGEGRAPAADPPGRPIRPVLTLPGPPKLDRHGDPLPAGAIARFGTVRLRHGTDLQAMGFTHDAKFLCTVSGSEDSVKLWDTVTGKEVARLNTPASLVGLARNGSVVLVDDVRIRVWLPATNAVRDLPDKTLPEGSSPTALAVNPDGRSVALAADGKVLLIDLQTGKTLKELNLPGNAPPRPAPGAPVPPPQPGVAPVPPPVKLLYSPDGRWLLGNGQKTGVWLWDLRSGKRVRTYRTEADFPEYTFSPDLTKLVVTGEKLHLYSLDSEEPVDGFRSPMNLNAFTPRFGADGKTVLVLLGDGSLQPFDAATGEEQDEIDAPEMNLRPPFALAPGGTLAAALDQTGGIRIWDPQTGKGPEVKRLPALSDPGFGAGGKTATVLDLSNKLHTFDPATGGAAGKVIDLPGDENGLPVTWDAAFRRAALLVPSGEDLELQILDADSGRIVSKYSVSQGAGVPQVSFARANRDRMVLVGQTGVVVLNPTTGKAVRSFNPSGLENNGRGLISPDGRTVAIAARGLTVWEVATGKKRLSLDAVPNTDQIAFSPDSRWLAAWDPGANGVVVVDLRTGGVARRLSIGDAAEAVSALAFAPDGKRLAAGTQQGRVTVWDATTGDTLAPFSGHEGPVTGLVFRSDGAQLVSCSQDGTALVWAVPDKPLATGPVEAAVTGFEEAFRLLGAADAAQAQRGLDYLYRNATEAVKQAGERVSAPAAVPAAKLAQLVDDLGSEDFTTRESAMKELDRVGGEAVPLLKTAVAKSSSPEVRKLAAELLGRLDAPAVRPDDLKVLRAVEALEHIGTPAARALLEKWAAGPSGHRLTTESVAAVGRLKGADGK
jgi:WD40 repeat protein